ncbi:YcaO-like family protein [Streptomyces sp. B6B3]|uniref:YcaO-like family protein n=1 Tax=Streptomyces sp. B6B3 TaxID=3153570 RepID=UPI00325D5D70
MTSLEEMLDLVGPYAAVTVAPNRQQAAYCPPWYYSYAASILNQEGGGRHRHPRETTGGGRSDRIGTARAVSVIEAMERAALRSPPADLLTAPAHAVPSAVPLTDLPVCSERELADPRCPLNSPDPAAPIRWVEGVELPHGTPVHLPAVIVYTAPPRDDAENFWLPISNGAAAGFTWESALLSGVLEVLERDIVSTLWLQRLSLPRLPASLLSPLTRRLVGWCERKYTRVHLFDATTEIGLPTVYCVLEAPHDPVAERVVAACTKLDFDSAARAALTEALYLRPLVHRSAENPEEADLLVRGAVWIGGPEGEGALDFLLDDGGPGGDRGPAPEPSRAVTPPPGTDERTLLRWLVGRCRDAGHPVYAVDLTTPDLRSVGLRVAKAVIPSLQPLNFHPHAQYLGHPRLHTLPGLLGQRALPESQLNPHPQPFA